MLCIFVTRKRKIWSMVKRQKDSRWLPKPRQVLPPKQRMTSHSPHPHGGLRSPADPVDLCVSKTGVWNNTTTGGSRRRLEVANDGQGHRTSDANDAKHLISMVSSGNASQSQI
jgi:hypothetical protein